MDDNRVSLGEVYRLMLAHGEDLKEIKADVKAQNGRVSALEKDAVKIKAYWTSAMVIAGLAGDWVKHQIFGGK